MSVANFWRYLAQASSIVVDAFVETNFQKTKSTEQSLTTSFLSDLKRDFGACLALTKDQCQELLRIHYADVRNLTSESSTFSVSHFILHYFIEQKLVPDDDNFVIWKNGANVLKQFPFPTTASNIEKTIQSSLITARLTPEKLKFIPKSFRSVFKEVVMDDFTDTVRAYFSNSKRQALMRHIQKLVKNDDPDIRLTDELSTDLETYIFNIHDVETYLLHIYFFYRVFKNTSNKKPSRAEYSLKPNETMTRIITYFGQAHNDHIATLLHRMGFKIIFEYMNDDTEVTQCIEARRVKPYVRTFLK